MSSLFSFGKTALLTLRVSKTSTYSTLFVKGGNEVLCGFMALHNYKGPLAPGLNFVKNLLTYFYSLLISSSALHLIAERLASVTADTSFKVFGLTQLRIEPRFKWRKTSSGHLNYLVEHLLI